MNHHRPFLALLVALSTPLSAQTVLEWALSETSPNPDVDDTPALKGTLAVPIIGDGVTNGTTNSSALIGRFTPVTLAAENDSITISYDFLALGGISAGGTNADLRWGMFNSNGTSLTGAQTDLSGWTGAYAFNSGSATSDADIRVRQTPNTERFYITTQTVDPTGLSDFANQDFSADGVIYTLTMTITRLAGDVMETAITVQGDDGYDLSLTGTETTNAEFTFDRVGFWVNTLSAEQVVFKASAEPASTDGDSIPDLEEVRWFHDLTTANDSSDFDEDGSSDLEEITILLTDPTDPASPATVLLVDFNADGTTSQTGPNTESGYSAYTAAHESNSIDNPAGTDFAVFGTTVNLAVDYTDDTAFTGFDPTVKEMIGRNDFTAAAYDGTLPELMRDWVGVDARASAGGNGPVGNSFGTPTNMTFTLSDLPSGTYQYRAYHHDAGDMRGNFELIVTDANRTDASLGNFQMTASQPTGGNPVYDATGGQGTEGVDSATLTFDVSAPLPTGGESRVLLASNIGQTTVTTGSLDVFIDDFPAITTGTSADRTWYAGIGYQSTTSGDVFYVDATLANTDIVGGGADSLWADGDDGSTAGTPADGAAFNDDLWRFRGAQGNGGIWEASGGSGAVSEDCVEIVTTAAVPNDTYDVFVFYYPVTATGAYPIRAGFSAGAAPPAPTNPGAGNPPSALSSTLSVPFESNGINPVVLTYRVYEESGDRSLSVVGVNGFEITEAVANLRVTAIQKAASTVTLTWDSAPDAVYDINAGTNLMAFGTLAADDIASQGTTTTHAFTIPAGLASESKVFFTVEEGP